MGSGSGKHHGNGANTRRSDRSRNRYAENVRMEIARLNKMRKQGLPYSEQQLLKLERIADGKTKRNIRSRHRQSQRIAHTVYVYDDHGRRRCVNPLAVQMVPMPNFKGSKMIFHGSKS